MTPAEIEEEFAIHWTETGMDREPDRDYEEELYLWTIRQIIPSEKETPITRWDPDNPRPFLNLLEKHRIPYIHFGPKNLHLSLPNTEMLIKPGEGIKIDGKQYYHYKKETR